MSKPESSPNHRSLSLISPLFCPLGSWVDFTGSSSMSSQYVFHPTSWLKTVFSHPQLWPGHHPHSGLITALLIKSRLPGPPLQRPPPVFPAFIPGHSTLPAKKPFLHSFDSLPISHASYFGNSQHWLRPLATVFSRGVASTELVRLSTHLLLSVHVSSARA